MWDIKTNAVAKLTYTFNNQKVTAYQDSNGYWWAKDLTGHGNSAFKVFEKRGMSSIGYRMQINMGIL